MAAVKNRQHQSIIQNFGQNKIFLTNNKVNFKEKFNFWIYEKMKNKFKYKLYIKNIEKISIINRVYSKF